MKSTYNRDKNWIIGIWVVISVLIITYSDIDVVGFAKAQGFILMPLTIFVLFFRKQIN